MLGEEFWTVAGVAAAGALALLLTRGRASLRARKKLPVAHFDEPTAG